MIPEPKTTCIGILNVLKYGTRETATHINALQKIAESMLEEYKNSPKCFQDNFEEQLLAIENCVAWIRFLSTQQEKK